MTILVLKLILVFFHVWICAKVDKGQSNDLSEVLIAN